jgi:hypothetical protein
VAPPESTLCGGRLRDGHAWILAGYPMWGIGQRSLLIRAFAPPAAAVRAVPTMARVLLASACTYAAPARAREVITTKTLPWWCAHLPAAGRDRRGGDVLLTGLPQPAPGCRGGAKRRRYQLAGYASAFLIRTCSATIGKNSRSSRATPLHSSAGAVWRPK